ncbi:MAG: TolC family protein [Bacteroidales bacterium]|nr:TolC family protein [Bacteroidales bacterium]
MRSKILLTIAVILIGLSSSYSQDDTLVLTLNKALAMAKDRSADAMIAKHRFRMNYWQYRSFKADYLPSVTMDAILPDFDRSYRQVIQPDGTNKYQYNTLGDYSAGMTINQKVGFTGGSVFLRSSLNRHDDFYDDSTNISYQSTPVIIGYSQPVFQYNEYRWARQLEPIRYEKAKRQYLEDVEQVSINTINHFFNLLLAQIERGIAEKNLNSYDTLFRIARGRYQLGKIAENELLQLELNYLRAKASVDNAKLNYEDMLFRLKSFLRLQNTQAVQLLPPAETRHNVINTSQAMAEARNREPLDQQSVNLGINVPILDWGKARGQIKVAESNLELEQTTVEQEIIDFEQSVFLSVMEFNMQKDQLYIAAKADTVAQKRYDVTQKRYMIGQVNDVLELNNAQIDNDNARKGYYAALRSYWINYYQLRKMTLYDFLDNKILMFDIREIM